MAAAACADILNMTELEALEDPKLTALAGMLCHANNEVRVGLNSSFMLFSAYLVFAMQAGFAMLCAGSVRTKNTMNILLKNVIDACAGAVSFYLFGYGFAGLSDDISEASEFIGAGPFALEKDTDWETWLFQWAFAAAAATIVSGAMAERTAFAAYLVYSVVLTGFVYPVVVHWVWSGTGWLSAFKGSDLLADSGMIDFAGSGVVHMTGGFAALAGAACVGPRIGRFSSDGQPNDIPGHSATLVVLGTFLLWVGWYGFNPGSMLAIDGDANRVVVGRVAVTTTLSGASAGLGTLVIRKIQSGNWDLVTCCNGALAGLVSITAGCPVLEPWAAIFAGAVGSAVFVFGKDFILRKLKVDDPVDAIALHGLCGAWGVFVVGLLAREKYVNDVYGTPEYGIFYGGSGKLLGVQICGIVSIAAWVLGTIGPVFMLLRQINFLRADQEEEMMGLDSSEHGGNAYYNEHGEADASKGGVGRAAPNMA